MAQWLPSNTKLTTKGISMLSQAQLGGTLTITKAVIGGTFSPTSSLINLTAIPNPVGTPIIGEKSLGVNGSTIKVVLANDLVTVSFPVCQIGIYATHPNVDGGAESLYLISQCEDPADVVPVASVNLVRLLYTLYIKHNSVTNPTITLDYNYTPTASPLILGGVKVGSNLSIDANGILSATGTIKYVTI